MIDRRAVYTGLVDIAADHLIWPIGLDVRPAGAEMPYVVAYAIPPSQQAAKRLRDDDAAQWLGIQFTAAAYRTDQAMLAGDAVRRLIIGRTAAAQYAAQLSGDGWDTIARDEGPYSVDSEPGLVNYHQRFDLMIGADPEAIAPTAPDPGETVTDSLWTYTHTQATPATVWTVTHDLGGRPSVTVVDGTGTVITPDIDYVTDDVVAITHSLAQSGYAYFS